MFKLIPLPYKILAVAIFICSVFVSGYLKGLHTGNLKLEVYKHKAESDYQNLMSAYVKAKNTVNEKVVIEYVDRIVEVIKWRTKNVEIVKEVPVSCNVSNGWVHVHDAAASATDADRTAAADGTSSEFTDVDALAVVADNYGICAANTEKLKAWQKWYVDQQQAIEDINKSSTRGIIERP
jgi:hypothetical protein